MDNQQGQEPGAGGGQEPRPQESTQTTTGSGASTGQEPETYDRAYVEKLRAEAAKNRIDSKELRETKAKLEEHETAKLGDLEKRDREITTLKAQVAETETIQARATKYEAALKAHLDTLRKDLPKHILELLDGRDPADQLEWLSKHQADLGANGRNGVPATPRATAATAADRVAENRRILQESGAYTRF